MPCWLGLGLGSNPNVRPRAGGRSGGATLRAHGRLPAQAARAERRLAAGGGPDQRGRHAAVELRPEYRVELS